MIKKPLKQELISILLDKAMIILCLFLIDTVYLLWYVGPDYLKYLLSWNIFLAFGHILLTPFSFISLWIRSRMGPFNQKQLKIGVLGVALDKLTIFLFTLFPLSRFTVFSVLTYAVIIGAPFTLLSIWRQNKMENGADLAKTFN